MTLLNCCEYTTILLDREEEEKAGPGVNRI